MHGAHDPVEAVLRVVLDSLVVPQVAVAGLQLFAALGGLQEDGDPREVLKRLLGGMADEAFELQGLGWLQSRGTAYVNLLIL